MNIIICYFKYIFLIFFGNKFDAVAHIFIRDRGMTENRDYITLH